MKGLPGCLMVVPLRRMRVRRWSTKGRSATGAPAVPASALLFVCRVEESCVQTEDTHDWTRSETTDGARTIWLPSQVSYIMREALLNHWLPSITKSHKLLADCCIICRLCVLTFDVCCMYFAPMFPLRVQFFIFIFFTSDTCLDSLFINAHSNIKLI